MHVRVVYLTKATDHLFDQLLPGGRWAVFVGVWKKITLQVRGLWIEIFDQRDAIKKHHQVFSPGRRRLLEALNLSQGSRNIKPVIALRNGHVMRDDIASDQLANHIIRRDR